MTYKEPTDLTDQKWLKEGNYFSASNLVEETGDLKLKENNALEFDGTNDYVTTNIAGNNLDITNAFTLECWIKFNQQKEAWFFGNYEGDDQGASLVYNRNGNSRISFYDGVGFNGQTEETYIDIGKWYHIALTRDNSDNYSIYINGQERSSFNTSQTAFTDTAFELSLGDAWTTDYPNRTHEAVLDGLIGEARVWTVKRTQTEIQDNMNKKLNGNEEGLYIYYPMNEGTGSTVYDESTNNNDGTISGASWVSSYSDFPPYEGEGTRISNPLALSGEPASSNIKWSSTTPTDTAVKIYTAITESDTEEPETWTEATNDSSISGATEDLTGKYLWLKQELTTTDSETTPSLSWVEVEISAFEVTTNAATNVSFQNATLNGEIGGLE